MRSWGSRSTWVKHLHLSCPAPTEMIHLKRRREKSSESFIISPSREQMSAPSLSWKWKQQVCSRWSSWKSLSNSNCVLNPTVRVGHMLHPDMIISFFCSTSQLHSRHYSVSTPSLLSHNIFKQLYLLFCCCCSIDHLWLCKWAAGESGSSTMTPH